MKRTFTKQLLGRTAMLLLTLSASLTAMGGAEFISGTTGPKWELTGEGNAKTLTISGTGNMPNFNYYTLSTNMPWYGERSNITTIVIEAGVEKIGDYSFYDMNKVESVTIPNSVNSIGESAFQKCLKITSISLNGVVTSLFSFKGCTSLETLTFTGSENKIGNQTFQDCTGLKTVGLTGVTEIGSWAFEGCSQLKSIAIPATLTTIPYGTNPFSSCGSLEEITMENGENDYFYCDSHNAIFRKYYGQYRLVSGCKNTTFPEENITEISASAFCGATGLTSITIPATVTDINSSAFRESGLTSVSIPNSVKIISMKAFYNCNNLAKVTFGNGLTEIGTSAFAETNVSSATFNGNPIIKESAFPSGTAITLNLSANSASGKKWASFYNAYAAFKADANTTVYKAKIEGSKVELTAIGDKIVPAGKAVILQSTDDPVMTTTTVESNGDYSDNILVGVNSTSTQLSSIEGNCYTLANGTHGVGFYNYTGTTYLVHNKAYFTLPASSRSFLGISTDDEATAIDAATKQEANDEWYTLDGRQMKGQPTKAGVYVKKNKVVVIK